MLPSAWETCPSPPGSPEQDHRGWGSRSRPQSRLGGLFVSRAGTFHPKWALEFAVGGGALDKEAFPLRTEPGSGERDRTREEGGRH